MREHYTIITRKGQITLPAEIRRELDLKQGDRITVTVDAKEVRLRPTASVVERTAGVFKTNQPPLSAEELRRKAEEAWAEDVLERMGG